MRWTPRGFIPSTPLASFGQVYDPWELARELQLSYRTLLDVRAHELGVVAEREIELIAEMCHPAGILERPPNEVKPAPVRMSRTAEPRVVIYLDLRTWLYTQ